jgi:hypothetical protein
MSVYVKSTLTRPIQIAIDEIEGELGPSGKFKEILKRELEGKCAVEGFIKKDSIEISKHSIGLLKTYFVCFDVEFTADVVYPVKDQVLKCIVIGPNHYGLNCRLKEDEGSNPCDVYVPRDHHHPSSKLNKYAAGSEIDIKVSGTRFEVNDVQITVIGSIQDGVVETVDVEEPVWTVEYVDEITAEMARGNPEKTYAVDSSLVKNKKELTALRKLANVRVLDIQTFSPTHANKELIVPFIESLQDAKTIVFPLNFADSIQTSEETYQYLKSKLVELGFQPVRPQKGGAKKEESFEVGDY